jgi:hypothetical protein
MFAQEVSIRIEVPHSAPSHYRARHLEDAWPEAVILRLLFGKNHDRYHEHQSPKWVHFHINMVIRLFEPRTESNPMCA